VKNDGPKCCGVFMEWHGHEWAFGSEADNSSIEIESSVWHCSKCGLRKAVPERWRTIQRRDDLGKSRC
jgi:ribosomal protein S27AE